MELMTKEIRGKIPTLDDTSELPAEKQRVYLKLFDPTGRGTWYATSFNGKDILFGYVVSPIGEDCDELGEFSLRELSEVQCRFGNKIERDRFWDDKTTLDQVINGEKR